jgi:hypothetical protein
MKPGLTPPAFSAIEQGDQKVSEQLLRKSQVGYLDLTYDTDKSLDVTMAFEVVRVGSTEIGESWSIREFGSR